MSTNTQNHTPERDSREIEVAKDVDSILGMNDFLEKIKKHGIKPSLLSIIDENKDDKGNKKAIEIGKMAISKSYLKLTDIPIDLLKDSGMIKEVIKSGIRDGVSYFELDDLIKRHFKLDTKAFKGVYKYFNDKIKQASRLYNDDLLKTVQILNEKESNLLIKAKETKLLTMGKTSRISPKFIKFFEKSISSLGASYLESSEDEKRLLNLSMLEKYLGIELKNLDEDELFFIKTVLTLSLQSIDLKKIDKTIEDEKEKKEQEENEDVGDYLEEDYDIEVDERVKFCYPGCSYNGTDLETSTGLKIPVSDEENKNFTTRSLRNYITFYNTLYDLGLNFLWDKHKSSFITLCNNKFGFNYMHGEGITESKLLSTLNLVGKNIGIPEKEIEKSGEGKTEKIFTCFDRLGEARLAFKDIKKSGKINGDRHSDLGAFSNGAVENYLESRELINKEGGKLNITAWK